MGEKEVIAEWDINPDALWTTVLAFFEKKNLLSEESLDYLDADPFVLFGIDDTVTQKALKRMIGSQCSCAARRSRTPWSGSTIWNAIRTRIETSPGLCRPLRRRSFRRLGPATREWGASSVSSIKTRGRRRGSTRSIPISSSSGTTARRHHRMRLCGSVRTASFGITG